MIKNMYIKAKSSVSLTAEAKSNSFPCNIGVQQGGNLSPLLFSIYLQNLKSFISRKCDGLKDMQKEHLDEEIVTYFNCTYFYMLMIQ